MTDIIVKLPANMGNARFPQGTPADVIKLEIDKLMNETIKWSDVPEMAVRSAPSSAVELGKNLWEAVTSPVQTLGAMGDIAAGALHAALPTSVNNLLNKLETNPEARDRAIAAAKAAGGMLMERYGSWDALKKTLATDPVGALSDLAGLVSGGGALLKGGATLTKAVPGVGPNVTRAADIATRVGEGAAKVGTTIDPLVIALRGTGQAANLGGALVKHTVGAQTGVGAAPLEAATKAGRTGESASFVENMRSAAANAAGVIEDFKSALEDMRLQRSAAYKSNSAAYAGDATILDMSKIDAAVSKLMDSIKVKGAAGSEKYTVGESELATIKKVEGLVDEWRNAPDLHTIEGLDGLKRAVDAVYPDSPKATQAQRVISGTYNAIKDTILEQAPGYAKTMKEYEAATDLVREIEHSLSLGNKAAADTTMRKLQSLMRNNVNTNYGNRLTLAKELEDASGKSLMPALAGQALSSWTPRGIQGATAIPVIGGASYLGGPVAGAISAATSSPRLMGETALKIGQAQRLADMLGRYAGRYSNMSPMDAARMGQQLQRWQGDQGADQ